MSIRQRLERLAPKVEDLASEQRIDLDPALIRSPECLAAGLDLFNFMAGICEANGWRYPSTDEAYQQVTEFMTEDQRTQLRRLTQLVVDAIALVD